MRPGHRIAAPDVYALSLTHAEGIVLVGARERERDRVGEGEVKELSNSTRVVFTLLQTVQGERGGGWGARGEKTAKMSAYANTQLMKK